MTILEEVLNAPYDYDNDIIVNLSYGEQERLNGLQYAAYSSSIGYTWKEENMHLSTPRINTILKEWGYRPVLKRDTNIPFEPQWDYRLITPNWPTFRLWLYVFYANKEVQGERTDQERDQCQKIRERIGNLATPCPPLHDVHTWARDQEDLHLYGTHREVKYLYRDLGDILDNYAGWASTEKVNG